MAGHEHLCPVGLSQPSSLNLTELDVNRVMFQTLEQGGGKGLAGFGSRAVQLGPSINTFCEPHSWMSLQGTCLFWHHTEGTWLWCLKLTPTLGSDNFSSFSNPSGVVLIILNFEEMIWPENPNFTEM